MKVLSVYAHRTRTCSVTASSNRFTDASLGATATTTALNMEVIRWQQP